MRRLPSRPLLTTVALVAGALLLASCIPPKPAPPAPVTTTTVDPPTIADGSIMGPSQLTAARIAAYVCHVGHCPASPVTTSSWKPELTPTQMAQLYIDEGNLVGVRGDIAFCQSILETGWFTWPDATSFAHLNDPPVQPSDPNYTKYLGYVEPSDHNYAGIGAFPGSNVFMRQATPQLGVRAQLQHLRNYADGTSTPTPESLGAPFVPRPGYTTANYTTFVYHGKAPNWVDLDGKWAVPGTTYGQTILDICNSIRTFSGLQPIPVPAASGASAQSELVPFDPSQVTFRY
jgi:N-acetylmuramoyl-L-alanine amidase